MTLGLSPRARVRLTLAALSVGLLAVGGDGLYQGLTNRAPANVTCAQLRQAAPTAAWVRVSGCDILYSSIGYLHKRHALQRVAEPGTQGQITDIVFPMVDPGDPSSAPLVVITNDARTIQMVTAETRRKDSSFAAVVSLLYNIGKPLESGPIEGLVRRGLVAEWGVEDREAISKMGVPLAENFAILDLGAKPSVKRSALLTGGGVLALALSIYTLVPRREDAVPAARPRAPAPAPAAPSGKWVGVSRLMLLNLGADAKVADVEHAPPLGSRSSVRATIAELLPGTTFDEGGWGQFTRADYTITFDLGAADDVQTAIVGVQGQPAIVAMRRLLRKTGWRLFSPQHGNFVEPETLGGLMASAPIGTTPEPLVVHTDTREPVIAWSHTSAAGTRYALLAFTMLVLLGWWLLSSYSSPKDEALMNQEQVIKELIEVGRANFAYRVASGVFTSPGQLANPENAARIGSATLPPLFAEPVRHGYRFEITGQEPALPDIPATALEPVYDSYVYSAVPVNESSAARSFAFISDKASVYSTFKGIPTAQDQLVKSLQ